MKIKFNGEIVDISSDQITLTDFLNQKSLSKHGTAIALNGKLIPHSKWDITSLHDNDDIILISAAFGG